MGTNRKKSINELRETPVVRVVSRFTGTLKNRFLKDLETGIEASDLIRDMAREYYSKRDNEATKHRY
jgi:hypothetical protein